MLLKMGSSWAVSSASLMISGLEYVEPSFLKLSEAGFSCSLSSLELFSDSF
jgi:1-deoxy-D-xylulose 5-phosphate reductoisomerase